MTNSDIALLLVEAHEIIAHMLSNPSQSWSPEFLERVNTFRAAFRQLAGEAANG